MGRRFVETFGGSVHLRFNAWLLSVASASSMFLLLILTVEALISGHSQLQAEKVILTGAVHLRVTCERPLVV